MAISKQTLKFRLPEFVLIVLVLISGTTLAFNSGGFVLDFQRLGFSVISSMQKGVFTVVDTVNEGINAVKEVSRLKAENEILIEKLKNYEYLQRNNTEIRKENDRLKEQLGFTETIVQKTYPAKIIGRNPDSLYSAITINKGSKHGIKKNMPVIAIQNGTVGLVGKVVTVGIGTSIVMPVYDTKCSVSTRIQNTRDIGLVSGQGNVDEPLKMRYIKRRVLDELSFGDLIVTSGEGGNYISDIPVGSISRITVVDYDSSLDIEITPVIDFGRLETVIVTDMKETKDY